MWSNGSVYLQWRAYVNVKLMSFAKPMQSINKHTKLSSPQSGFISPLLLEAWAETDRCVNASHYDNSF